MNQRVAEKIQTISPVVSRIFDEFYSPAILRCLYLLYEAGQLDPIPEGFNLENLAVEYTDKLSQKLDQLEISQIMKSVEESAILIGADQQSGGELGVYIKIEEAVAEIFRRNGVEPKLLNTKRDIKKMKEARAEAQAQQAQMQAMSDMTAPVDLQARNDQDSFIGQMMTG